MILLPLVCPPVLMAFTPNLLRFYSRSLILLPKLLGASVCPQVLLIWEKLTIEQCAHPSPSRMCESNECPLYAGEVLPAYAISLLVPT